jgi:hypothetical protein
LTIGQRRFDPFRIQGWAAFAVQRTNFQ